MKMHILSGGRLRLRKSIDMPDAAGRWGSIAKAIVPISTPEENLIDQLALVGLQPSDIDVVVNSHFHSDHCGCNDRPPV